MEVVRRAQGAMPTSGQGPSTTTLFHDPSRGRTLAALGEPLGERVKEDRAVQQAGRA